MDDLVLPFRRTLASRRRVSSPSRAVKEAVAERPPPTREGDPHGRRPWEVPSSWRDARAPFANMHACLLAPWVHPGRAGSPHPSQEVVMILLVVAAVLAVLWLLGFVAFHVTAFAIHLLLIAAVIAVIAYFVTGNRSGRTRV